VGLPNRPGIESWSDDDLAELWPHMDESERATVMAARGRLKSVLKAPDPLITALHQCIAARQTIPAEQKKIAALIKKARNETEREAREYQKDLVAWQLNRAADVAQKRLKYLDGIKNRKRELEKIADGAEGAIHWFEYYAWGFDPRADSGLATVPLSPFERQKEFIAWLEDMVFIQRSSGVAPKSRDMGATVIACDWSALKWLVVSGFTALLSSRKDDLVDSQRNPDTLFEKIRMQLRLLPAWMMPESFDWRKHSSGMMLANPNNGSVVSGEAPVKNFGRQQRATVVIMDEFAAWPDGGYAQKDSVAGGTSKSVIEISSVKGKFNQFYEDWISEGANVFTLNWKDHPWKDARWYASLPFGYIGPKMSKELIAQEIDMDPEASQPGRVWPMYSEIHTVITMSELRRAMGREGIFFPDDGDGRPRIPQGQCEIACFNDRGATAKHRNAWLWCWRLPDHRRFSDCVFFFREWLAPIGATFRLIVDNVRMFEAPDDEDGKMALRQNSHEAESERVNYSEEYGLEFEGWKTDYESGIAQITEFLTVIHKDKPHPLRDPILDQHGNVARRVMGYTRMIIVTQDGQGELRLRENGEPYVEPGTDFMGMMNLRRQIQGYHYPPEEAGKPVGQMRPEKKDDDLVDDARAAAIVWGALTGTKSEAEDLADRMKALNPAFAPEEVEKLTGWDYRGRMAAMNQARRRLENEDKSGMTGSALLDYQERLRRQGYL
jgi:hypothetical protein